MLIKLRPWRKPARNAVLFDGILSWADAQEAGSPCPVEALDGIRWEQGDWFRVSRPGPGERSHLTAACVAGAALILAGYSLADMHMLRRDKMLARTACRVLGITGAEGTILFAPDLTAWQLTLAAMAFRRGWVIDPACLRVPPPVVPITRPGRAAADDDTREAVCA